MTQHDYFISVEMNGQRFSHQSPKGLQAATQPSLPSPPRSGFPGQPAPKDVQTTPHGYDIVRDIIGKETDLELKWSEMSILKTNLLLLNGTNETLLRFQYTSSVVPVWDRRSGTIFSYSFWGQ